MAYGNWGFIGECVDIFLVGFIGGVIDIFKVLEMVV